MTTILVATTGGHLAQLERLSHRLDVVDDDQVWVTHSGPQSESLLSGRSVEFVPYIDERDVKGVLASTRHARALIKRVCPTAVVSTGSAIALGYLGLAAISGIPAYYIESAARAEGPSRTGRILCRWPRVHVFTQYPGRANDRWGYAGSVFDEFEPVEIGPTGSRPLDVVVTVGSSEYQFDRLLDRVATIAPSGTEIRWQIGRSNRVDLPGTVVDYLPAAQLSAWLADADAVIAHAGCGSAMSVLVAEHIPILVQRETAHGEIGDDHQDQLAEVLSARGLATNRTVDQLVWSDVTEAASRRARNLLSPSIMCLNR